MKHGTPHVGKPNIRNRKAFIKRVNDILDKRWLSNNWPVVQEFEKRAAEIFGSQARTRHVQCHSGDGRNYEFRSARKYYGI